MNSQCKTQDSIEKLTGSAGLVLDQHSRRVTKLRLMTLLAPHEQIPVVIYRLGGDTLDKLLRPLLTEARSIAGKGKEREGDKRFRYLTYTLSNALASHVDMAWHHTVRYHSEKDQFSDIEVLVLANNDSPTITQRLVEAVINWLSADLVRERLGELAKSCQQWIRDGMSREELMLLPPSNSRVVAYPTDSRYFQAMALTTAMKLRQKSEVCALLSPGTALEECQNTPRPALRVSSQGIDLIGEPEQKTATRWVSNVLRIKPKSEIDYGQLTVNVSLHTRVYGDLTMPVSGEAPQTRQLMLYRRLAGDLILQQYPFNLSTDGADFVQEYPQGEDLAGQSIKRLYSSEAGPVADSIPLQAGQYGGVLAMPLLAQGLGDNEVSIYTGASAPERHDVYSIITRVLKPESYVPLPELLLISQIMPRKCHNGLYGVSVFRQAAIAGDTQVAENRRTLLTEYLRQRGGTVLWSVVLAESRVQENYASSGNEWMVALSRWSGLKITRRWTTPRLDREFKLMEQGLSNKDRYGCGSWSLFTGRSKQNEQLRLRAELYPLRDCKNKACKSQIEEIDWDRHWEWSLKAELISDEVDEVKEETVLSPEVVATPDFLNDILDKQLAFKSPIPAALKARREMLKDQLGPHVAIPVFTLRKDLCPVVTEVLIEILGKPESMDTAEAGGQICKYPELDVWLGYWPQTLEDAGLQLSTLLPKSSGPKWRQENAMHGQQRQRCWLRQLEPLQQKLTPGNWQVMPLVALLWGTQNKNLCMRDPKPWLRDLFNRFGWMAKFILQSQNAPTKDTHTKDERQRIHISLLAQLTNHGVLPTNLADLLREHAAIKNLAALTVIKNKIEVIPVVWRITEQNVTQMGLRDESGGVSWHSTVEATKKLASRDRNSALTFARDRKTQQEQATLFWERLTQELDQVPALLIVNGQASRMSFTRFMNRDFAYDKSALERLIVVRIDASEQPQYFAKGEEKTAALSTGFSGFYSHSGCPRRSLLLAAKGPNSAPYKRSRLENRFLELGMQPERWPELQLDLTDREIERKKGAGQGAQMRTLVECVITDLPMSMGEDINLMQYVHGLVKVLQDVHIEYPECTNYPYPLHELEDFAADMIKATAVKGINFNAALKMGVPL